MAAVPTSVCMAQEAPRCRVICEPEWKVEPTVTIENLANRHRVVSPDGATELVSRARVFETVLALNMSTKVPRLGFTVEAITSPFSEDNSVELEFESNFHWLTEPMSRGWVTSHFDVVDQFSPAQRPEPSRAYTTNWISNSTLPFTRSTGCARAMAPWRRIRNVARLPCDRDSEEGRCLPRRDSISRRRKSLVFFSRVCDSGRAVVMPVEVSTEIPCHT